MMHPSLLTTITTLLAIIASVAVNGAEQTRLHQQWLRLTTEQLMEMGNTDMDNGGGKDTALVCYSIVAGRYERSMSKQEKRACKDANMQLWSIYYYDFFDYPKCFDCLANAREIADEAGIEDANIYIGLGCMYQTISQETGNFELGSKSLEYYIMALNAGLHTGDDLHTDMACTDVLSMASIQNGIQSVEEEWQKYYGDGGDSTPARWLRQYNKLLHDAYTHLEGGRHDEAIAVFNEQLDLIDSARYQRLVYFTCVEKAKVYAKKGDFIEAINELSRPKHIALALEMKDMQLEVFELLAQFYRKASNENQYATYRERYIALKDTLTSYRQLASIGEMEFTGELKKMDRRMTEMRHHRELMTVVAIVAACFSLVLTGLLLLVFHRNRQLRRRNRSLYEKNVEMLRREEQERQMRRQLQAHEHAKNADSIDATKYKNSTLDETDKQQLQARITDIMETSDEVYSPDFSVERLAVLTESKYKYVSQVIHEQAGQNFNAFINEYRIREACKRISDREHYGHLTIEAISQSVGFKSRSAFVSSFKRITGLTPSEYMRAAREAG